MGEEIKIRPIHINDARDIHEMQRQDSIIQQTMALSSGRLKDIEDYIEGLTKEDHVFVAECNGHVRGVASLEERSGKLRYSGNVSISINEEVQGRGIGKTLLERIVKLADEELGLIRLELDVCADNIRALALYEMFHFKQEGYLHKAHFSQGKFIDVIIMGRIKENL